MLLEDRSTVIYGEGGAIGAVARAFAREGARIFLAGRTLESLDAVAGEIFAAGGTAETARVDALDEQSIERHIGEVVEQVGSIDVSFNAISIRGCAADPACGYVARGFRKPDRDRPGDALPDGEGGGAAHG